jgi:hypothetical protein
MVCDFYFTGADVEKFPVGEARCVARSNCVLRNVDLFPFFVLDVGYIVGWRKKEI